MKQLLITALLAITGIGAQAQKSETRKSEDFKALEVQNGIEVIFTQSKSSELKVETDNSNNLQNIITEYRRGTLKVYMREQDGKNIIQGHAKVYVSTENITDFKAITGSSIKISGKLTTDALTVKLATGASFSGEVQCLGKM